MGMKRIFTATLFSLAALPALAQDILSNPGLCNAPGPEQELAGTANLYPLSVEAHGRTCNWITPLDYVPGLVAEVDASCDGQEGQSEVRIGVAVNSQGRVTVSALNSSTGLPDYYFPCELWGFKG